MPDYPTARIIKLVIYPSKGFAGVEISSAMLSPSGLSYGKYADHQFMVVCNRPEFAEANKKERSSDGVYCFVTQRDKRTVHDNPQGLSVMALIKPQFVGDRLQLTWNYGNAIDVPYDANSGRELPVKVWDYETCAVDQGNQLAEWLSDNLGMDARLVKAAGSFKRMSRQNYMRSDNPVYFHDAYPIHWFPVESVDELSERANENIPWQSFRPQIVVHGTPPQYEHRMHEGLIAGIPFTQPKPCERCPVTLVNQDTGRKRRKRMRDGRHVEEPLYTLGKYKSWIDRHLEIKPIFGENMNPDGSGSVHVGDELTVVSERNPLLEYGSREEMETRRRELKASHK